MHELLRTAPSNAPVQRILARVLPVSTTLSLFLIGFIAACLPGFLYERGQLATVDGINTSALYEAIDKWSPAGYTRIKVAPVRSDVAQCHIERKRAWRSERSIFEVGTLICPSENYTDIALDGLTSTWKREGAGGTPAFPPGARRRDSQRDGLVARAWRQGIVGFWLVTSCPNQEHACDNMNASQSALLQASVPSIAPPAAPSADTLESRRLGLYLILAVPLIGYPAIGFAIRRRLQKRYPPLADTEGDCPIVDVEDAATGSIGARRALRWGRISTLSQATLLLASFALGAPELFPMPFYFTFAISGILWLVGGKRLRPRVYKMKHQVGAGLYSLWGSGCVRAARIGVIAVLVGAVVTLYFYLAAGEGGLDLAAATVANFAQNPTVAEIPTVSIGLILLGAHRGAYALAIFLMLFLPLLNIVYYFGRRLQAVGLRTEPSHDERPYFLLLRSFDEDFTKIPADLLDRGLLPRFISLKQLTRFEEVIAHALGEWAPIHAVNPPGQRLPQLGSAKISLRADGEHWRSDVEKLAKGALAIIVQATPANLSNDGLGWELDLLSHGNFCRLLVVLGPWPSEERGVRWERFRRRVAVTSGPMADLAFVANPGWVRICARSAQKPWSFFGGKTTSDATYVHSIAAAISMHRETWVHEHAAAERGEGGGQGWQEPQG